MLVERINRREAVKKIGRIFAATGAVTTTTGLLTGAVLAIVSDGDLYASGYRGEELFSMKQAGVIFCTGIGAIAAIPVAAVIALFFAEYETETFDTEPQRERREPHF